MKNNFFNQIIIIFFALLISNANSSEQFNFDVTEIEILDKGNIYKGLKRGTITTNDGIELDADEFEYNKALNILNANGNVKIKDSINNYLIFSDKITYLKNENIIITNGNSKAVEQNENITIDAKKFEYYKLENKILASEDVVIKNNIKDYKIFSNKIEYLKNQEKFLTYGFTRALIESKYVFKSSDVTFFKDKLELFSKNDTTIFDNNFQFYKLSNFYYSINKKELKGEKIIVTTNYNLPKSDKFYFSSAIIDLKNNNFVAGDTEILVHKNIFSNEENDPRILGVSSNKKANLTTINKGIFTSCKKNDKCPPWSISARKIEHDQTKKQITYDQAILKIYDKPVLYFPKFFIPILL